MHLIRHRTPNGPAYAALQANGEAHAVEGDILGHYRVTDRLVTPGKRLAPIVPANIIGIALNYRKHAEETGKGVPKRPMWFAKTSNAIQHPGDPIYLPKSAGSEKVDFEGELAVLIGKPARNVKPSEALSYVFGYTIANDVSARDWQYEWGGGQFCQAKSFDTFCPLGPVLVTADSVENPNQLHLQTRVNDQVMQDWSTDDMVFSVAELISFLSQSRTLTPGTVILTGTPHGVGAARTPPVWLKAGDVVSIEIEGLGALTNPVANEP